MIAFKQNSVGRRLFINANVDLTTVASLVLNLQKPDGATIQKTGAQITIVPNDNEITDNCGNVETWAANTYCFVVWEIGDLDVAGIWKGQLAGDFPDGFDAGDIFHFKVEPNIVLVP